MKKIMFNNRYGLTDAVLEGRKTMTRRIMPKSVVDNYFMYNTDQSIIEACRFKIGDVVAIAQSYNDVNSGGYPVDSRYDPFRTAYSVGSVRESDKGWKNKMLVRADLMPHHIKITDIRVERLQDCSDDDILKEGVSQISAQDNIGYTFKGWTERGVECSSETPRGAFKALINKTCGRCAYESNPLVFVVSFKLLD